MMYKKEKEQQKVISGFQKIKHQQLQHELQMQIEEKRRAKDSEKQAQRQLDIFEEKRMRQENEAQYLKMIHENSKI